MNVKAIRAYSLAIAACKKIQALIPPQNGREMHACPICKGKYQHAPKCLLGQALDAIEEEGL
jgi:hypothetical protein